jgi:hypothetical protein
MAASGRVRSHPDAAGGAALNDYPAFLTRLNVPPPDTDATIMGLERKLEVLRAQLATCQAGGDVGSAGIAAWTALDRQAGRMAGLEADLAATRCQLAALEGAHEQALAIAEAARRELVHATTDAVSAAEHRDSLERDLATAIGERDSVRHLLEAAMVTGSQAELAMAQTKSALALVLASRSWRLTRPIRVIVDLVRGFGS